MFAIICFSSFIALVLFIKLSGYGSSQPEPRRISNRR